MVLVYLYVGPFALPQQWLVRVDRVDPVESRICGEVRIVAEIYSSEELHGVFLENSGLFVSVVHFRRWQQWICHRKFFISIKMLTWYVRWCLSVTVVSASSVSVSDGASEFWLAIVLYSTILVPMCTHGVPARCCKEQHHKCLYAYHCLFDKSMKHVHRNNQSTPTTIDIRVDPCQIAQF